jgi:hypothetical protein
MTRYAMYSKEGAENYLEKIKNNLVKWNNCFTFVNEINY